MEEIGGEVTEVLDPNKFSDDGTASLGGTSFDDSGRYLAYSVSEGGSDWRTAYVKDLQTGEKLSDKVDWIKFSGMSWKDDGFYYSRYPASDEDDKLSQANEYHSVYYHKLGTSQDEDELIYRDNDNPQRNAYAGTTDDEKYLVLYISESTSGNALKILDLSNSEEGFMTMVDSFDSDYNIIHSEDNILYVLTNNDAPNQRLITIDINNPAKENWVELIKESENTLRSVSVAGDKLFANYMVNASTNIKVHKMDGSYIQDLELPGIGSVSGISGDAGEKAAFYSFTSYTYPTSIFSLDTETLISEIFKKPDVDFDSDNYTTEQVWYTSKDGTKVPMFLTYKKGLQRDGTNPTLLYGYGGFDIPLLPGFSVSRLPLLENGGIYAVANIRGGGEFGKKWHKAGTLGQKQNVFDDFQAAAEHLINEKYTNSEKLAIEGGSNGGLLVGACITQRPDLYKVAFPRVGVLDMLRYHEFTIGWAWATDYGRSDNEEDFEYLIKYSPLHNVKEVAYPATLVTTADHDDRVVPAHSFKFISELQDKHNGSNPVLIRIETSAGHGAGKPTSKRIDEAADMLSFMFYNFGEKVDFEIKG
jgi:prolyl oligopeptidase